MHRLISQHMFCAVFLIEPCYFPCLPIPWFHLRLHDKMYALIDLMGVHSHIHIGPQRGVWSLGSGWGTEDMQDGRRSTRGHQIRALPSDRGCDGMDGKCVGVCVSRGYHPLCSEMFGGERIGGFHVARWRFIPIQRTIIVDLALPEKARINRGLINQL